jgi:hypothetical protein
MHNPFRRQHPICPVCNMPARIFRGCCSYCEAEIYVPLLYFRWIWLLVVAALVVVGAITYNQVHPGAWLLGLVFLSIPLRIIFGLLVPPWFETHKLKSGIPFILWYVSFSIFLFIYWQVLGWTNILLGASRSEFNDTMGFFSMPLCWVNPRFFITPERSFLDVCGILAGNSFFFAVLAFVAYRAVHARLLANGITRMNLTTEVSKDEEGDE